MGFEDIIVLTGDFQRYQIVKYILLVIPAIVCGIHTVGNVFLEEKHDYRCLLPNETIEDASFDLSESIKSEFFPRRRFTNDYDYCKLLKNGTRHSCSEYVFSKSNMEATVTKDWQLVCSRAYLGGSGSVCNMCGSIFGSLIYGPLADNFGRKKIYLVCLLFLTAVSISNIFSPNIYVYLAMRLLTGANTMGIYMITFILAMEMVGPSKRFIAGMGTHLCFCFGYIIIVIFALLIKNWRMLQIAYSVCVLVIIPTWFWAPESVMWLLSKGRYEDAKKILMNAVKVNKIEINEAELDNLIKMEVESAVQKSNKFEYFQVFKHRKTLLWTLVLFYNWAANACLYYGITWASDKLPGNLYVTFSLMGLVEIPAYIIFSVLIDRLGRKYLLFIPLILCGILLCVPLAIPKRLEVIVGILSVIGKFLGSISFAVLYMFTSELYPTTIRNSGLAAASISARFGSMAAAQINVLNDALFEGFNLIVFAAFSVSAALLVYFLPETKSRPMPSTLEETLTFK